MTNVLHSLDRGSSSAFRKHRPKGWSPERRARQAELIRRWAPWRRSTGPRTEAGKARCAKNALRHGFRSGARILELQRVRYALRLAASNIEVLKLLIRIRREAGRLRRFQAEPGYANPHVRSPWHGPGSRVILPQNLEGKHAHTQDPDAYP